MGLRRVLFCQRLLSVRLIAVRKTGHMETFVIRFFDGFGPYGYFAARKTGHMETVTLNCNIKKSVIQVLQFLQRC